MSKGYVYIMTSAVDGIIKIGNSDNWTRRCQNQLEDNGYKNMNGLKTYFVVECDDYLEIESIMHDIFRESRVIGSNDRKTELFAVDKDRAKRVLAKMGTQVYPEIDNKISKTSKTSKSTAISDLRQSYNNFWSQFNNILINSNLTLNTKKNIKDNTRSYINISANNQNSWIGIWFKDRKLNIDFSCDDIELFKKLQKYKDNIEKELGYNLIWSISPQIKNPSLLRARASYYFDFEVTDITNSIDADFMLDVVTKVSKLQKVFSEYVNKV